MDQDWQDTLLTQKRIPHRLAKSQSKASTFDVKKLFGRYQVTCHAAKTSASLGKKKNNEASLEMYRLSDDAQGVLGEIHLPGVMSCEVVMSGSRKSLARVISRLEPRMDSPSEELEEKESGDGDNEDLSQGLSQNISQDLSQEHTKSVDDDEDEEGSESENSENDDDVEEHTESRLTFEKNSFRNPKFWLNFKSPTNSSDFGTGYLVFSGNDCRRFKGTLCSDMRRWDNIALTGWKSVGMSERDVPFHWCQDSEQGV